MKQALFLFVSFLIHLAVVSQVSFSTIVSKQTVVKGEAFQVQYAVSNATNELRFLPPVFTSFRVVNGPEVYSGTQTLISGVIAVKNYVYTLEALQEGRFTIPAAVIVMNGRQWQSNKVGIHVISKNSTQQNETGISDQQLLPGEDPYKKMNQNLFLKLLVNRTSCFVGEPVLATFKLYSRLSSKSDIVKNPGFYGFTVFDVINLADNKSGTEQINGKWFDVHTVRQVQLYPLRAGVFSIDPMEVQNEVAFTKSSVNSKPEQEISEGAPFENAKGENMYENTISTQAVMITVKPLPEHNKPEDFAGATGNFNLSTRLVKSEIAMNEEGFFEVMISGKGNFTQLNAPEIKWPKGIEGFAPIIKDSMDKMKFPLEGFRIFRYPFIASKPGNYELPAIRFSFFESNAKQYKTASSLTQQVLVSNKILKTATPDIQKSDIGKENDRASRIAIIVILSFIAAGLAYWIFAKRKTKETVLPIEETREESIEEILLPVKEALLTNNPDFLNLLYTAVRRYLVTALSLEQGISTKEKIIMSLQQKGLSDEEIVQLDQLFSTCEAGMFTNAHLEIDKNELLLKAEHLLNAVKVTESKFNSGFGFHL
ncbi:MAG: BatD family protein [Chitinophagaceae bacterium]